MISMEAYDGLLQLFQRSNGRGRVGWPIWWRLCLPRCHWPRVCV